MNELELSQHKKSYQMLLKAIDGRYYSIELLGENKIINKKQFEYLKSKYTWATDF